MQRRKHFIRYSPQLEHMLKSVVSVNTYKNKVLAFYKQSLWASFFSWIRFWTGSYERLEKIVPKKGRILDLGCGYGIFANYLALCSKDRTVYGVDTDVWKINNANHGISNVAFSVGDATKTTIKNLDCVLILDVLHHLNSYNDQEGLIKDCKIMLKKNGILVITEVDKNPLWKLALGRLADFMLYKGDTVYYRYRKDMVKMLKKYFANVKEIKFHTIVFPRMLYICENK